MGQPDDDRWDVDKIDGLTQLDPKSRLALKLLAELRKEVMTMQNTLIELGRMPIHMDSDYDMGRMYTLLRLGTDYTIPNPGVWKVVRLRRVGRNVL